MDMLRHLRVFVAVAEEGHFGDAARRLDMSQPAVSQILRRLETHVGTDLIRRTHRGADLTDAGRALLPRARLLVDDADRLIADARRFDDSDESVRWGVTDLCGRRHVAACARRVGEHSPAQSCATGSTVSLVEQVTSGGLDVAVVEDPALHSGLRSTASVRLERMLVVPDGRSRPADLADLDFAYPARAANPPGFDQLVDSLRAAGMDPRPITATSTLDVIARVAAGTAYTVTADPAAYQQIPGIDLVSTAVDRLRLRLRVVYRSDVHAELAETLASGLWRLGRDSA